MTVKDHWRRIVAEIAAAGTARGRARLDRCSLEGTRVFERALRAGAAIDSCVVSRAFLEDTDPRIAALRADLERAGCTPHVVPDAVMDELTGGRSIGDVVGLARMPRAPTLAALLEAAPAPALFLAAVGLDDPGNAGALVRTAHASGAAALLAAGSTDAFHPRAVRTSMGSVFRVPVLTWPGPEALISELRAHGVRTLAAVVEGGTPVHRAPHVAGQDRRPTAVIVGSEAFGLEPAVAERVDLPVTIPMPAGVDSFSVNAAAAILLYEVSRPLT